MKTRDDYIAELAPSKLTMRQVFAKLWTDGVSERDIGPIMNGVVKCRAWTPDQAARVQ